MNLASSGAAYRLALASRGEGGGDAVPYDSSFDARRAAILNAVLLPTVSVGGKVLSEWDRIDATADLFEPLPEVPNALGQFYQLRCDALVDESDEIGTPYSYDDVSEGEWGTIRATAALPIPDGQRASGYDRSTGGATSTSATPGVEMDLWDATDAWTWAIRTRARASGAGAVYSIDTSPNTVDELTPGITIERNNALARFKIIDTDLTVSSVGAGSALTAGEEFVIVAGYERTSGDDIQMFSRLYTTAGVLLRSDTRGRTIPAAKMSAADPCVVHDAAWVATYPGVRLTDEQADDVADGTDVTGAGTIGRYMLGIYTGIYDPSSSTRLIVATGVAIADEPIATWSRS